MRLLVTGGLGFIGSCFIRQYIAQAEILNIDKIGYASQPEALEHAATAPSYRFKKLDLATEILELEVFAFRPDWIIHFAAESHVDNSIATPEHIVTNNVMSTLKVLQAARRDNIKTLLVSTDEVFGEGVFTETTPYDPHNPYSASKACGDLIANAYHHTFDTPVIVTHSSNNFGEWQHREKLIPTALRAICQGKPVPIYGTGQNVRDWIYVEDHCSAIWHLLEHGKLGQHYCIGARVALTNVSLMSHIFRIVKDLRPDLNPQYEFVKDRPGHDTRYTILPDKIEALGWKPQNNFEPALRKTVQFYLR